MNGLEFVRGLISTRHGEYCADGTWQTCEYCAQDREALDRVEAEVEVMRANLETLKREHEIAALRAELQHARDAWNHCSRTQAEAISDKMDGAVSEPAVNLRKAFAEGFRLVGWATPEEVATMRAQVKQLREALEAQVRVDHATAAAELAALARERDEARVEVERLNADMKQGTLNAITELDRLHDTRRALAERVRNYCANKALAYRPSGPIAAEDVLTNMARIIMAIDLERLLKEGTPPPSPPPATLEG